jgi:hypothetical protein
MYKKLKTKKPGKAKKTRGMGSTVRSPDWHFEGRRQGL